MQCVSMKKISQKIEINKLIWRVKYTNNSLAMNISNYIMVRQPKLVESLTFEKY